MSTVLCVGGESLHTRQRLLKNAGFQVITATTEYDSLAAGRKTNICAVILDSQSPVPNLPRLAGELKCERPLLPVLLVTDAGMEDAPEALAPFDRVISRLEGPKALLRTLGELTSGVISLSDPTKTSARETRSRSKELREKMLLMRHDMRRLRDKLCNRGDVARREQRNAENCDWADVLRRTAGDLHVESRALMKQARDLRQESERARELAAKGQKRRAGRTGVSILYKLRPE